MEQGLFQIAVVAHEHPLFPEEDLWQSTRSTRICWNTIISTTHQPGARHAPYRFVSGYLFSKDITRIYDSLKMPVWVAHGIRGDFVDYTGLDAIVRRPNWMIEKMPTGALPHFEMRQDFLRRYEAFLAR